MNSGAYEPPAHRGEEACGANPQVLLMFWISTTAADPHYLEAVRDTKPLGEPAEGFVKPNPATSVLELVRKLIKQNSVMLELAVQQAKPLDSLEKKVVNLIDLRRPVATQTPLELQKSIEELQEKLQVLSLYLNQQRPTPKPANKVYFFKVPRVLIEEVGRTEK